MAKPKEAKIEDVLEPGTESVDSDTSVSPLGEEIPEGLEPEGEHEIQEGLVEETPTPSEPVPEKEEAPVEEGEPEREQTPFEKEFYAKGLDKQFGTPEEMLRRVPEMNKHINDLSVERKELRKLKEQATSPAVEPEKAPSADDFYNDPVGTIDKLVAQKQEQFNQRFDEMEANAFINSKPDYAEMEPLMEEALAENPGLRSLGIKALKPLYEMAKGKQLSRIPPVTAPKPNKTSAETSAGKRAAPIDKTDPSYWHGKTTKEIEAELGMSERQYRD